MSRSHRPNLSAWTLWWRGAAHDLHGLMIVPRRPYLVDVSQSRHTERTLLARGGLMLLPLGGLLTSAWMAQPARPPRTHAVPARSWAGADPAHLTGGHMAPYRVDAVLPGTIKLLALNGTNGFLVNGISAGDQSGRTVRGAGDVNGDGFDDILIGARFASPHGVQSGQSYLVYGGPKLGITVELSSLNGTGGFIVNGISSNDKSGWSVSGAGDVNGDGFDDILIGAPDANRRASSIGQSYVVYGGATVPGTVDLSSLNGAGGFRVNGEAGQNVAVSGAGDVNGDGFDDILIGEPFAGPTMSPVGKSYVVYGGSAMQGTVELSALNGASGFSVIGTSMFDLMGWAVSGAGDVNHDGFDDILIGAISAAPHGNQSGQSYVVYGGTAVPGTVQLSLLNGTNGFTVNGITRNDLSGFAVSGAGDVNRDGFDDILIGAVGASPHGPSSGQSYVVFGGTALPAVLDLSSLDGTIGFRINGISTADYSGVSVGGAGDVNSDGFGDILIGAHGANPSGAESGQIYIVYGGTTVPGTIELSALDGTNGLRVNGISTRDYAGLAVSGAGDVNGDGFDDILIGAPYADPHGSSSGQSYVVYGNGEVPPTPTPGPTAMPTPSHPRGDCNADDAVKASDVSALVLEIFDGDGTKPAAVPGGTFPGDPIGCNANADAVVDAGDLACVARLIFGSGGGCGP